MLTFVLDNTDLIILKDADDKTRYTCEQILEAMSNSIDIDFIDIQNEGAPIYLGNDYAEYQVNILSPLNGKTYTYGIGPIEAEALHNIGMARTQNIA